MEFKITVLPGDGIGPEVVAEGLKVLRTVGSKLGHGFNLTRDVVGGAAIDKYGVALRPETVDTALGSDAVLFGAVGGPKWEGPGAKVRAEDGLLALRKALSLFANIRPVKVVPERAHASVNDVIIPRDASGSTTHPKAWAREHPRVTATCSDLGLMWSNVDFIVLTANAQATENWARTTAGSWYTTSRAINENGGY